MKLLIAQKLWAFFIVFFVLCLIPDSYSSDEKKKGEADEDGEAPAPKKKFSIHDITLKSIGRRIVNTFKGNWVVLTIFCIFLIAFTRITVASGSMEPTVMTGDKRFLVDCVFGYKPERGDIIGFTMGEEVWLKRVIGLPGDLVEIYGGKVHINGEELEESYLQPRLFTDHGNSKVYTVPDGCLFVLGDNRTNSYDSRYWATPYIETSRVIGVYKGSLTNYVKSLIP